MSREYRVIEIPFAPALSMDVMLDIVQPGIWQLLVNLGIMSREEVFALELELETNGWKKVRVQNLKQVKMYTAINQRVARFDGVQRKSYEG